MYRDVIHTSHNLQMIRFGDADPTPRRNRHRPGIWVGTFLMHLGERFHAGIENLLGTRA